jgi:hypothetical protein
MTPAKHAAQAAVLSLAFSEAERGKPPVIFRRARFRGKERREVWQPATGAQRVQICVFLHLVGFTKIQVRSLFCMARFCMAGTTRLELATAAVTVSGLRVLSTTWKSTDGTASHWKYIIHHRQRYCVSRCVSRSFARELAWVDVPLRLSRCNLSRRSN